MRWIRRAHLYSGMLMFPWVMLYGITATLFNHPGCLSETERDYFTIPGENLSAVPEPVRLAERLLEELVRERAVDDASAPGDARYVGSLSLRQRSDERDRFLRLDIESGATSMTTRPRKPEPPPAPFARKDWFPTGNALEALQPEIESDLRERGFDGGTLTVRSAPKLRFRARIDGADWNLEYTLEDGVLTGRTGPWDAMPLRNFALRLHIAHGFPGEFGPRWLWAVLVDLMFLTMVFWGTSGVLMCIQMRRVRRTGLIFLALGFAIAAYLVAVMYSALSG